MPKLTMDRRIKKLWVKALRSGDYKQGQGRLRTISPNPSNPDTFCCLGVLCNIHAQEHPEIASTQTIPRFYLGKFADLPDLVIKWAGLEKIVEAKIKYWGPAARGIAIGKDENGAVHTLASLNDSGASFKVIADLIEKRL